MDGTLVNNCPIIIAASDHRLPYSSDGKNCTDLEKCSLTVYSPFVNSWNYILFYNSNKNTSLPVEAYVQIESFSNYC